MKKNIFQTNLQKNGHFTHPFPRFLHMIRAKREKEVINMSCGYNSGFALIVVLFILLIIVGAAYIY